MKKILVVGGGIAGVACAGFLDGSKFDVTIVERSPEWRTIGFSVSIWTRGISVLRKLNLPKQFWDKAIPIRRGVVLDEAGDVLSDVRAFVPLAGFDSMACSMLREDLHKALVGQVPLRTKVRFETRVDDLFQDGGLVHVTFSDGSQESFDLVVGADGMRSSVRSLAFGNEFLKPYGWHMLVGWCSQGYEFFKGYDDTVQFMSMPAKAVLTIPSHGKVFFGISVPYSFEPEKLLTNLKEANPLLSDFVDGIERNSLFTDELVRVEMDDWHKGRVVLVGDARHGLSPVSGFGTTLALEDAYVLADCLKSNESIDGALSTFAEKRNRSLRKIRRFARLMERSMMVKSSLVVMIRNAFSRYLSPKGQASWLEKVLRENV